MCRGQVRPFTKVCQKAHDRQIDKLEAALWGLPERGGVTFTLGPRRYVGKVRENSRYRVLGKGMASKEPE